MKVSSEPDGSFPKIVGYMVVGFLVAVLVGVLTAVIVAFSSPARAGEVAPVHIHIAR